ncbi:MAG: enoyl-CoA hydratase-related protein [Cyclobacteriaceae bacterium]|nr:enoyl-CoA hydratase-related protein [Cyclobacteriaceae bacterium]
MQHITYHVSNRVARITLNRPEKRNALNAALVSELITAFEQARQDEQVKVIVLAATGEAFCAGADLAYLQHLRQFTFAENLEDSLRLKNLFVSMYTLTKAIVAQVQGPALAGGCGLVTVCDFAVSATTAKFGYTEVKIGFVPAIVTPFLIKKIGEGKARNLLLSGNIISAQEAVQLGLISHVTEPEKLEEETMKLVTQLVSSNSGESLALTKTLLHRLSPTLDSDLQLAAETNARARSTADCRRGIAAFLNKEKLMW